MEHVIKFTGAAEAAVAAPTTAVFVRVQNECSGYGRCLQYEIDESCERNERGRQCVIGHAQKRERSGGPACCVLCMAVSHEQKPRDVHGCSMLMQCAD